MFTMEAPLGSGPRPCAWPDCKRPIHDGQAMTYQSCDSEPVHAYHLEPVP